MVDIFDEVDEELRAERAQALLKRYAPLIVAVAVLIIAAAGGWQAWRWWQAKQDMAAARAYLTAMAAADSATAAANRPTTIDEFANLARTAPEGYSALARLRAAALKADAGDVASAAALWNAVATDPNTDPLLRDLASLLWAQHQIDTGDPALLATRLKALAEPGNVWRPLAEEGLALLDLRQGKTDAAKTTLTRLANDLSAPQGVRGRAAALLARLG